MCRVWKVTSPEISECGRICYIAVLYWNTHKRNILTDCTAQYYLLFAHEGRAALTKQVEFSVMWTTADSWKVKQCEQTVRTKAPDIATQSIYGRNCGALHEWNGFLKVMWPADTVHRRYFTAFFIFIPISYHDSMSYTGTLQSVLTLYFCSMFYSSFNFGYYVTANQAVTDSQQSISMCSDL